MSGGEDRPTWATDTLYARGTVEPGVIGRVLLALHVLLGGPLRVQCVQHTQNEIGRAAGFVELSSDWPAWMRQAWYEELTVEQEVDRAR